MKMILLSLSLFAPHIALSSSTYECRNVNFLAQPFTLVQEDSRWSLADSHDQACPLRIVDPALDEKNYEEWTLLSSFNPTCSLLTKLASPSRRALLNIKLSPKILQEGSGYAQIQVDNSSAEYGPDTLRTFVYCSL